MKRVFIPVINIIGKQIENRRFSEPPVYIGGCGRSGTTLLLSILSAHNDIFACPRELNLFQNAGVTEKGVRTPKFYRLYRTFITQRIKSTAVRYCEKSPSNIQYIELIDQFHGGKFKLLHIVRDGRDVILSKHPRGKDKYWVEPERWINDVSAGLKYSGHSNVCTIKYEDLIGDYETTIVKICLFLELEVTREILNWHEYATVRENNALYSKVDKLNNSSIGKWKNPANDERVQQLKKFPEAMALLRQLRYL